MSGSAHPLKVSQELLKAYTQRRNSHLASATGDGEHSEEPDPYAFVEGDEEFSFTEKKDKSGTEREGGKKYKVGLGPMAQEPSLNVLFMVADVNIFFFHQGDEGAGSSADGENVFPVSMGS